MTVVESIDERLLSFHAKVSGYIDDSDTLACAVGEIAGAHGLDVPLELVAALRIGASWGDE
ncbi:hypothetical protein [Deinococcus alpinitundrae]|uniref:hypothetical protein n=1 Tax=Deinococcus alpinitundrae TaxID=468913 RepID=UPI00137B5766|nr:hypothetical protein [Deinococcus alpinitundrae]